MSRRLPSLVTGMVLGAGLLYGAGHLSGRARSDQATERASVDDEPARAEPSPLLAAAAVRVAAAAPSADFAAVSARLERIEQRLDGVAAGADARRAAAARAEEALITGATPEDRDEHQQGAFDRASAIVDRALAAGVWTDGEQGAMREAAAEMLPADRFTLKMKLSLAGNEGKLRDTAAAPMFF